MVVVWIVEFDTQDVGSSVLFIEVCGVEDQQGIVAVFREMTHERHDLSICHASSILHRVSNQP